MGACVSKAKVEHFTKFRKMDESRGLGENPNVELAEVASWDILSTTRVSTWEQQQGCWTCIRVALAANIGCVSSCTPARKPASAQCVQNLREQCEVYAAQVVSVL